MNGSNLIQNKFSELGFDSYEEIRADVGVLLNEFENSMKINLPESYKYFLKNYGECNFERDAVYKPIKKTPFQNKDGFMEISYFYGCGSTNGVEILNKRYKGRLPKLHIVLGEAPGGNQICMNVDMDSSEYGNIYVWDHENECEGCMDNMYLVSRSFDNFIDSFVAYEKENLTGAIKSRFDF